jgi:hypothetical protein
MRKMGGVGMGLMEGWALVYDRYGRAWQDGCGDCTACLRYYTVIGKLSTPCTSLEGWLRCSRVQKLSLVLDASHCPFDRRSGFDEHIISYIRTCLLHCRDS